MQVASFYATNNNITMALLIKKNRIAKAGLLAAALAIAVAAAGTASAQALPSFSSYSDLTVGSRGAQVVDLQGLLSEAGYMSIGLPTGYFGSITKGALASFQKALGVSATGYFGPLTRSALSVWMANAASRIAASGSSMSGIVSSTASTPSTSPSSNGSISTNGSSISMSLVSPLHPTGYWYQGNWYSSVPAPGTPDITGYWVNGVWTPMQNVSASVAPATNVISTIGTASTTNYGSSPGYGISGSNWDPSRATPQQGMTCTLNSQNVYVCH